MFSLNMSVTDWEEFFLNRSNTRELTPMVGGVSKMSYLPGLMAVSAANEQQDLYAKLVQAILNRWAELAAVERVYGEAYPIEDVAGLAFGNGGEFRNNLRSSYERLWQESPRPHGKELQWMALNSRAELPVSRAEVGLMFELEGWGIVALCVASKKGWTNDAVELFEELEKHREKMTAGFVVILVQSGFPKEKGLRWLQQFHADEKYAQSVIARWSAELAE